MQSQSLDKLFQNEAAVMGILNLTPDSFSDGGDYQDSPRTLDRALQIQEEGADCLDVGAESTRPGAEEISTSEQWGRLEFFFEEVLPILKIPVSIDTRNAKVAEYALKAGAKMVNDVSAFEHDPCMLELLARSRSFYVLMHHRGDPRTMSRLSRYENCKEEVMEFFEVKLKKLFERGIQKERVFLDVGIGFAKQGAQNMELLAHLNEFKKWNCPLLIGLSRKSFLEEYLGPTLHPKERNTELAHFIALQQGAHVLRVHDVKAARQTIHFFQDYQKMKTEEKS